MRPALRAVLEPVVGYEDPSEDGLRGFPGHGQLKLSPPQLQIKRQVDSSAGAKTRLGAALRRNDVARSLRGRGRWAVCHTPSPSIFPGKNLRKNEIDVAEVSDVSEVEEQNLLMPNPRSPLGQAPISRIAIWRGQTLSGAQFLFCVESAG